MAEPTQLPSEDELEQIKQTEVFKAVYADNTVAKLHEKLDEKAVTYRSTDDKTELTWRYLKAQANTDDEPTTDTSDISQPPSENQNNQGNDQDGNQTNEVKTDETTLDENQSAEKQPNDGTINDSLDDDSTDTNTNAKTKTGGYPPKTKDESTADDITIKVKNIGAYGVLEPHTQTLLKAKETSAINLKPKHDKGKVLRNIEQLNRTRGNVLQVQ